MFIQSDAAREERNGEDVRKSQTDETPLPRMKIRIEGREVTFDV